MVAGMIESATLPSPPPQPLVSSQRHILLWTAASLLCILAWDGSGLDLAMARWFGDSQGFALRSNWFMVHVAHEGARTLAWLIALVLTICIWWPMGFMRQVAYPRRIQLMVSMLVALAVMAVMKRTSATSCPWDLAEFGGVARYASHWALGIVDGGGGRCFPAGHASAGFAFLGGYFALRRRQPRAARLWLAASLAAGLVLGGAQQVRGAHFMSHTLWTGWLCWTTGWLCDLAAGLLRQRFAFADSQLPPGPLPPATT